MFLFDNLSAEIEKELKSNIHITTKYYNRGEKIFLEGNKCESIAYIKSGTIVAKNLFVDGHESIVRILNQNDSIGEALIYSSSPYYKATFISETYSCLEIINSEDLKILLKNEIISRNLTKKISDSLIHIYDHIKILNQKTVRAKICLFLYQQYLIKKSTCFTIPLNKTELSTYINTERPTLSNIISQLCKENIISNKSYTYTIINLLKLEKEIGAQ